MRNMKTGKKLVSFMLIMLAAMGPLSCMDITDLETAGALLLEAGGPYGETAAIEGYGVALTGSRVEILADDGTTYRGTCAACSNLDTMLFNCPRVVARAGLPVPAADAGGVAAVEFADIRVDLREDDITISGRVEDIGERSFAVLGNDGVRYEARCHPDYAKFIRSGAFWDLKFRARTADAPVPACGGIVPVTIVTMNFDRDALVCKTGTVTYNPIEGGFWCIMGDDGKGYDMSSLPADYNTEGLRVRFTAKISDGCSAIHQWGFCIELTDIVPL